MSHDKYNDDCSGCRLILVDPFTLKPFPYNDPVQQAGRRAWARTTRSQRESFHRVTCLNSQDWVDMQLCQQINQLITEEVEKNKGATS